MKQKKIAIPRIFKAKDLIRIEESNSLFLGQLSYSSSSARILCRQPHAPSSDRWNLEGELSSRIGRAKFRMGRGQKRTKRKRKERRETDKPNIKCIERYFVCVCLSMCVCGMGSFVSIKSNRFNNTWLCMCSCVCECTHYMKRTLFGCNALGRANHQ